MLALLVPLSAANNGLARTPPLGWRSWNAFGGGVTQAKMEAVMSAMVDASRGESLRSLGYDFIGLDDGWQLCGAGINGSFHDEHGVPIIDTHKFPSLGQMVDKAHSLGLKAGWYLNNCICNERSFTGPFVDTVQRQDVAMLRRLGFDGLKLDSCSQWNNLTRWNELITASGAKPILLENCHQGGLAPGARQWQTYTKRTAGGGGYEHRLGYLSAGHDAVPPLLNVSFDACETACTHSTTCAALCFEADAMRPAGAIVKCYLKTVGAGFVPYDASNAHCRFDGSRDDCPYNFYRTSGDINAKWGSMLANLGTMVRFLNANLSQPGTWAYPDMLELGRLANATEDRSHFGAWAITSSPLILGFDATDAALMERVWPIVSNREVLAVSQSWAGVAGRRLHVSLDYQLWTKPLGGGRHALLVVSNATVPISISVALSDVAMELNVSGRPGCAVIARNLYSRQERTLPGDTLRVSELPPHDSSFVTLRVAHERTPEPPTGSAADQAGSDVRTAALAAPRAWRATYAAADPLAAQDFSVRYLGARAIPQPYPGGNGTCALITCVTFDASGIGYEFHFVSSPAARVGRFTLDDWARYMEALNGNLSAGVYNQYMDNHVGLHVADIKPYIARLEADSVPYFTRRQGTADHGCDVFVQLPNNGIVVELACAEAGCCPASMEPPEQWDLCTPGRRLSTRPLSRATAEEQLRAAAAASAAPSLWPWKMTYASTNPEAAAAFVVEALGARHIPHAPSLSDKCGRVRWVEFAGGYQLHFVHNPHKLVGNMTLEVFEAYRMKLHGDIRKADGKGGNEWYDAFMDNHAGVLVDDVAPYVHRLEQQGVPYFTRGPDPQDVFVMIPGGLIFELAHVGKARTPLTLTPWDLCDHRLV